MSSNLVAFVRARLDEDEQVARRIETAWRCIGGTGEIVASDGTNAEVCAEAHWEGVGEHIVRHDPARVLREVEAKRRMVADLEAQPHVLNQYEWYGCRAMTDDPSGNADLPDVPTGQPCTCGRDDRVRRHLELLALPYADHPDYRAEWAP